MKTEPQLAGKGGPETHRFNVIEIIADQHNAQVLGCEGHRQAITPNLDRLAAGGTRFTAAYTQSPICTPSRVSILSGQYCHNHGYYGLGGPTPPALPTFLGHFRANGYRTAAIGKLHLPDDPTPMLAGQVDLRLDDPDYRAYLARLGLTDKEDVYQLREYPGGQQLEGRASQLPFEHSQEGWVVAQALEFIQHGGTNSSLPFCMQISFNRPHQCHTPDQRFWDMYSDNLDLPETFDDDVSHRPEMFRRTRAEFERGMFWTMESKTNAGDSAAIRRVARRIWKGYLASVTHVDYAVGQVLDFLDRTGLATNTIVLYHADHGTYTTAYRLPEKAPGISGDMVCRVPMLWRVPGRPAQRVSAALVENVDLAPTLVSLCGLPAMQTVDGRDLSALLAGASTPVHEEVVTEHPWSKAIRFGKWRFVHYQREMFDGREVGELYDLQADPLERRNLFSDPAQQDVVAEARQRLLEWMIGTARVKTVLTREAGSPVAGDGRRPNDRRDDWRADWELENYL
jgi:choline-sulfatase/uncharacterized sulfatase